MKILLVIFCLVCTVFLHSQVGPPDMIPPVEPPRNYPPGYCEATGSCQQVPLDNTFYLLVGTLVLYVLYLFKKGKLKD